MVLMMTGPSYDYERVDWWAADMRGVACAGCLAFWNEKFGCCSVGKGSRDL